MGRAIYRVLSMKGTGIKAINAFLAPDEKGKMSGMVIQIKESRPYKFISIEPKGIVVDGKEIETQKWAGSLENYTFK